MNLPPPDTADQRELLRSQLGQSRAIRLGMEIGEAYLRRVLAAWVVAEVLAEENTLAAWEGEGGSWS